jgi:hypothetical protein
MIATTVPDWSTMTPRGITIDTLGQSLHIPSKLKPACNPAWNVKKSKPAGSRNFWAFQNWILIAIKGSQHSCAPIGACQKWRSPGKSPILPPNPGPTEWLPVEPRTCI